MDAVEEVKVRLSIEDVISEYVQLKRSGRNWKGLSPFSGEKTPSFMVSPEKQIWHDFSSGKGGNMFSFIMEVEGLDFKGALELLARKAGIDLDQFRSQGQRGGPNKERIYEALDAATKFYQVQFSKNKTALEYVLKKRQFSKETALEWRLGYAPNTGSALVAYLKKQGFTEKEVQQAGLMSRFKSDMFRGRLMIPLQDPQGRVIGFTARLLSDDPNQPKYINTPQTVLYDKSRHIYGLHLAKESIRKSKFVVLTEGNLDVIASHQAGVRQVVATAGTALTEPHLKALSRFTGDIRLSFDADRAGLAATERAIPIASRVKVSLSVITIPSGKDPDELIKQDPAIWKEVIQKHEYALDWLMARYQKLLNTETAEGKRQFSDVLLPVVQALNDPVEKDHYLNAIASAIGVSKEALTTKLKQTKASDEPERRRRIRTEPKPLDKTAIENQRVQDNFLALGLLQPPLRTYLDIVMPEMFSDDERRQLFVFLQKHPDFSGKPEELKTLQRVHLSRMQGTSEERPQPYDGTARTHRNSVTQQRAENADRGSGFARSQGGGVQNLGDYVKIEGLLYEELYQGLELTELHYEAARLRRQLVEQFVKNQKQSLAYEMASADEPATQALLERAKQYDVLLKQVQGGVNA